MYLELALRLEAPLQLLQSRKAVAWTTRQACTRIGHSLLLNRLATLQKGKEAPEGSIVVRMACHLSRNPAGGLFRAISAASRASISPGRHRKLSEHHSGALEAAPKVGANNNRHRQLVAACDTVKFADQNGLWEAPVFQCPPNCWVCLPGPTSHFAATHVVT